MTKTGLDQQRKSWDLEKNLMVKEAQKPEGPLGGPSRISKSGANSQAQVCAEILIWWIV
jgi:hypothetical protein